MKVKIIFIILLTTMIVNLTPIYSCIMFNKLDNGKLLIGNNEDWTNPYTKINYEPAENKMFGFIYFSYAELYPLGGINDQGLVFDGFMAPYLKIKKSKNKQKYNGNLIHKIMRECSTVEEVLTIINQYNLDFMERYQYMFVDKNGDSIIIEGDKIIKKDKNYQVVSNFYLSEYKNKKLPCERYKTAVKHLINNDLSIKNFEKTLYETRSSGISTTLYSNIYDIKNGKIYIYYFSNFEEKITIDIKNELSKGKRVVNLPDLFKNKSHEAIQFLENYKSKKPKKTNINPDIYKNYTGTYIFQNGYKIEIIEKDNKLYYKTNISHKMIPYSENQFYFEELDLTIKFINKKNKTIQLIWEHSLIGPHKAKKI